MQNLIDTATPPKKNYNFIDTIRGLSMLCIVADHCFCLDIYSFRTKTISYWTYIADIQLVKIGTITFFLLAGFLIGDKFSDYSALDYLKRRFDNTFRPWIIWSLLFVFIIVITPVYGQWRFGAGDYSQVLSWTGEALQTVYLYSSYWFIINFLICIGVLLLFKKRLYSLTLGVVLLLFTCFYSINVYFEWIKPLHTIALFGFIFFLWLGAQLFKKWNAIQQRINNTPMMVFVLLFLATWAFSVWEIDHLYNIKSLDPFNSLRISNILYSIAAFFLLIKIKNLDVLNKLKPRETTYGIYLIHYIFVYSLLPELQRHTTLPGIDQMSLPVMVAYQLSRFFITYIITYGLVTLINKTKFKWVIGR